MKTAAVEARTPRRYSSQAATQAELANRNRYVFTAFRDLHTRGMRICRSVVQRCVITLIESFPYYVPALS